jgi:hypothetical protein
MRKDHIKLIWALTVLIGLSLACQSINAIREDYTQARGTVGAVATQAQQIVTQVEGIATEINESDAIATGRALATEYGPSVISTSQALATKLAEEGYLLTAEALVTQGSQELIPTIEAFATESLFPAPPPEDIPIFADGDVTNLFSNLSVVSYYVDANLAEVIDFYKTAMPTFEWLDVSDEDQMKEGGAILKFFKPERVATVTLTSNPVVDQTIVLITIISQ